MGRVARRQRAARGALLAAGQKLFASQALEAVTIDTIAGTADIAKGSFYAHFPDKEGLASAIVEQVHTDFEREIVEANPEPTEPAEAMARALCVILRYAVAHPDRVQAMLNLTARRTFASEPLNAHLVEHLSRGMKSAAFLDAPIDVALVVVVGLARAAIERFVVPTSIEHRQQFAVEIIAALLRALGVEATAASTLANGATTDLLSPAKAGQA